MRSGPGTQYPITGTIRDKGVYTIVDTQGDWGKLKSGAGWISLNYTLRL
ncbi:MAG: SH3 domain-containing protein [Thermoanaerobacteraceae bacterium]|nr:SH3 domain-containing protein [Thermoanaerobacteraceae bacterium]